MIDEFPDFFNGTDLDNDGNNPRPTQTAAPSTAKNILAVGGSTGDCFTFFGITDCESGTTGYTSKGPATEASLRMAPKITAPNFDLLGGTPAPRAGTVAVFRSRDNDNLAPIEAELDEGNFGTSYAAAYVAGLAAIVNDYFGQGFYPTGARVDAYRVARISSSLGGRQRRHYLQRRAGLRPRRRHPRSAARQLVERVPAASGRSERQGVPRRRSAGLGRARHW